MTLQELAIKVLEATESIGLDFMIVGAVAAGAYGVPRSTKDVDLLVAVSQPSMLQDMMASLDCIAEFDQQVVFDTLTRGTSPCRLHPDLSAGRTHSGSLRRPRLPTTPPLPCSIARARTGGRMPH